MLTNIHPKLPMRDKSITKEFYLKKMNFEIFGNENYDGYLMLQRDNIQVHFFEYKDLDPKENYGQVYIRTNEIEKLYQFALEAKVNIPSAGHLEMKSWNQKEFSILDPDNNLLTFGQNI